MIIAIDGPSGSGKSSIAKKISQILNFNHLDTGAMYRLLALKLKKENREFSKDILKNLNIYIKGDKFYLDNIDVSLEIRENEISKLASSISKIKEVRDYMVSLQRELSKDSNVVLDGRDIGTVVFPNADFKFFITASPSIRAKRRFKESKNISYETILEDIIKRDNQDITRDISPLEKAKDAIEINTDDLNLDQVINKIIKIIKKEKN